MNKKVLVAMSGGVDSSVAAYLLKKAGYDCIGCTMKLFANEDVGIKKEHTCCSLEDVEDARSVAFRLGMPHYVFNFKDNFATEVIDRFVTAYIGGDTPNPCIDCNKYIKFNLLYKRAQIMGCDFVATGHYAIIGQKNNKYYLKKGIDPTKDQSYVLYSMTQNQLAHTLFPLGNLTKAEARKIAEENGFINSGKPDSQDICFVPNGNYVDFIERHKGLNFSPGNILDETGKILGKHTGAIHFTVGQRKGLGLSAEKPLYVIGKDMQANTVTVGFESALFAKELVITDVNWVSGDMLLDKPLRCKAMTRYRKTEQWATVQRENECVKVIFDEPQRAITTGQALVLYDNETVIGGGVISKVINKKTNENM